MSSKFRSKVWDPLLLTSQIVSMQFQFYTSLLLINYLVNKSLNLTNNQSDYTLDNIFDHRLINFNNAHNSFLCFTFITNSLLSALFEWKLINRSKQCLDFTVTVFLYHIIVSWLYVGTFPSSFSFWLVLIICGTLMTVLSEYLCMQSALKEIPLSLVPKANL